MPEKPIISPDEAIEALQSAAENGGLSAEHIAKLSDIINQARGTFGATLSVVESPLPNLELITKLNLDKQYEGFADMLKFCGFINPDGSPRLGDVQLPSLDRIKRAFGDKKLDLAQSYSEPRLVIYPDMPFQELIKLLQNPDFGLQSVYASDKFNQKVERNNGSRISSWGASIIDARPIVKEGDDRYSLRKRLQDRSTELKKYESQMTRVKALMFMLDAIRNGRNDGQLTILLDGEKSPVNVVFGGRETTNDEILYGFCDTKMKKISFSAYQLGGCVSTARLHSSVDADNIR